MTPALLSLLSRLRHIEQSVGTLTDRTYLTGDAISLLDTWILLPEDLDTFKGYIEGKEKRPAKFKPPQCHLIYGFLFMLCGKLEEMRWAEYAERVEKEKAELNALFKTMPSDKQAEFKAWVKKPPPLIYMELTDSQIFQLFKNG